MGDFDPDEIVNFDNRMVSLRTAVRNIMSKPPHMRAGVAVFREGEPGLLDADAIERLAAVPGFLNDK